MPRKSEHGAAHGTLRPGPPESSTRSEQSRLPTNFSLLVLWLLASGASTLNAAPKPDVLGGFFGKGGQPGTLLGMPMQILLLLTTLSLLPAIVMVMTPFLRITIVLHFLRQALGTQTVPSNQLLVAVALFMTAVVVHQPAAKVYDEAWKPYDQGDLSADTAWEKAKTPIRTFLAKYVREKDVQLLIEISHSPLPKNPSELGLDILVPAYVLSELKTGFQIGAALYIPFLVIDLIVASVTLSVGMVQLPPAMLSAPFKVMLFVLVDGWNLVVGSLLKSFL